MTGTYNIIAVYVKKYSVWCCLLLLGALAIALHFSLPRISEVSVQRLPDGEQRIVQMPHFSPDHYSPGYTSENGAAEYAYTYRIEHHQYAQSRFNIYPYGCIQALTINEHVFYNFSQEGQEKKYCTSSSIESFPHQMVNGVSIDLKDYLRVGTNTLKVIVYTGSMRQDSSLFKVSTHGIQLGPVIFSNELRLTTWIGIVFAGSCAALLTLLVFCFTREWISGLILSAGFLAYVKHLTKTGFMKYTPDMPSHLEYIAYIANHGSWPHPFTGWQYYQPPLYYHLQSFLLTAAHWLRTFDTVMVLQFFSLSCLMVFLIFSSLTLRRIIKNPIAYYAVLLFVVFYPGSIIYSTRLDSHLLYYAFYAGCCYFLLVWLQTGDSKSGQFSMVMFSLALATRSNALSFVPCYLAVLWQQWRNKALSIRYLKSAGVAIGIILLLLATLANFGRTFYFNTIEHKDMSYLVVNAHALPQSHRIANTIGNFLLPDVQSLLNTPYWHLKYDYAGRQNFWVSILKTSLFDYFPWRHDAIAKTLLTLLLLIVSYVLCSLIILGFGGGNRLELSALSLALLVPIMALMINRIVHPYSASQNFRYIYPVIVSFAGIYGILLEQYFTRRQYILGVAGALLALVFAGLSCWFVLAQ